MVTAFSDHRGQLVEFPLCEPAPEPRIRYGRRITAEGLERMHDLLYLEDWSFLLDESISVNDRWLGFIATFGSRIDLVAPLKPIRVGRSGNGKIMQRWFTPFLGAVRKCLLVMNACMGYFDSVELSECRKKLRAFYRRGIRLAKIRMNDHLVASSSNPGRDLWRIINSCRDSESQDGIPVDPDVLNDFFINVADNVLGISRPSTWDPLSFYVPDIVEGFSFVTVSAQDVMQTVADLRRSCTRDVYGISTELVLGCIQPIVLQLTNLINLIVLEAQFPDCLKIAQVVPIYKKGDRCEPGSYRPISLLPIFSKIVEKVMKAQLVSFFERHCLIDRRQFGFQRGRNTQDAISSLVQMALREFENGNYFSSTFYDLAKAFDCMSHGLLIAKLIRYGLKPGAVELLESYLGNRRQFVSLNGTNSGVRDIHCGVPQGSVLGPFLFLIYFNDLPQVDADLGFHLFADDTTVSFSDHDLGALVKRGPVLRDRVMDWFGANLLRANLEKTVTMIMSTRHVTGVVNPPCVRFLGVLLDPGLDFRNHVDALALKLNRNTFLMRRLSGMVSAHSLRTAYYGLIFPHIQYAILIWGHTPLAYKIVFRLQRRVIRIVFGLGYREDCRSSFISGRILTYSSIYILGAVMYAHRTISDRLVGADVHNYETRGRHLLRQDCIRLHRSRNCVNFWSVKFYNCLPLETRGWSVGRLRTKLRDYLRLKCFYSFQDFIDNDFGDFV